MDVGSMKSDFAALPAFVPEVLFHGLALIPFIPGFDGNEEERSAGHPVSFR